MANNLEDTITPWKADSNIVYFLNDKGTNHTVYTITQIEGHHHDSIRKDAEAQALADILNHYDVTNLVDLQKVLKRFG